MKTLVLDRRFAAALACTMLAASALTVASARADDIDDDLLWSVGEFELGNGDAKTIAEFPRPESTRICVGKAGHPVPLKVEADGRPATIAPGACGTFEARRVSVSPGGRLGDDTVLIGRYRHLRR